MPLGHPLCERALLRAERLIDAEAFRPSQTPCLWVDHGDPRGFRRTNLITWWMGRAILTGVGMKSKWDREVACR